MLKITYAMYTKQKWDYGSTEKTEERAFYGKDEFDIDKQLEDIMDAWYADPCVKSVSFKEIKRERIEV